MTVLNDSSLPAAAPFDAAAVERAERLLKSLSERPSLCGVLGFDGFVDEIIDVVDHRSSPERYERIETIAAFAERIGRAAGLSTNLELVSRQVKLGGNGPIMANALLALGADITYIGSLGSPEIHPVFHEMVERCRRVISLAPPGHTDALEFRDGKVMLGKLESLKDVTWENILRHVPPPELTAALASADLLAMVNWTMLPGLTEIWERLRAELLPAVAAQRRRPLLTFFDLSDPEKRPQAELRAALAAIDEWGRVSRAVLGLNLKEARQVAAALGGPDFARADELAAAIAAALPHLHAVVVHPSDEAAAACSGTTFRVAGPYTPSPRLTTGAGDNFNAGLCLGLAGELDMAAALALGTATSGFYVRHAHSPSLPEVASFLEAWRSGELSS
ncbi:MAG TPA: PfkB family carbohydrate kinase [Limnochordia bacterium]